MPSCVGVNGLEILPLKAEQITHGIIIHRNVQVCRRDTDIGMPGRVAGFSKTFPACQCVRYERMPPVVNGQRLKPFSTEAFARSAEPLSERVTRQRCATAFGL